MISSDKIVVQSLVETCLKNGMNHVVCSPGSRNSPIVIALDEHPQMTCYVIHDERSAAFIAIGMAQQLKVPVGVVCTSGSALLNYYPAVAEAFYQRIPLVVISADRPEKWINQGDGQTIVQRNVYENHIEAEIHLSEEMNREEVANLVFQSFQKGNGLSKGPIHINVALEEPLYNTVEIESKFIEQNKFQTENRLLNTKELERIKEGVSLPKKLILIGQMPMNDLLQQRLLELANDPSYAILVENTSNLVSQKWIHCIDRTLERITNETAEEFAPDLLITFGGAVVSKRIKAYFRKYNPKMHWKVGFDFPEMNTYEALTDVFQVNESYFLQQLTQISQQVLPSNFGAKWKQLDFVAQQKAQEFIATSEYCDLTVFDLLLDTIPEKAHFQMANSSVVRYCQLFDPIQSIHYYGNRGTSGIDGSTSTAVGGALIKKNEFHVLITGDISFFYDSNALWNNYKIPNLRIFLINNGGGGIFNIIKGPRTSKQNQRYFEAQHQFNARDFCKCFNIEYFEATSLGSIENQLEDFYTFQPDGGIKLMEINTVNCKNHLILDDYFEHLKS